LGMKSKCDFAACVSLGRYDFSDGRLGMKELRGGQNGDDNEGYGMTHIVLPSSMSWAGANLCAQVRRQAQLNSPCLSTSPDWSLFPSDMKTMLPDAGSNPACTSFTQQYKNAIANSIVFYDNFAKPAAINTQPPENLARPEDSGKFNLVRLQNILTRNSCQEVFRTFYSAMSTKAQHAIRYAKVAPLLRAIREEAGLTQRAMGKILGEPQSWVHSCETASRRVDVAEFCDWCTAAKVCSGSA
jgi:hypothetical protein